MDLASRKVLEGVERISWEGTSCLCLVGSTIASLRYLGEEITNDYVMGVSGGAFKIFWEMPWSPANCSLLLIGEEPVRRSFVALGYDYSFIPDYNPQDSAHAKELFRKKIVDSIDSGHPVIAVGVVGPPECSVITGYDKGGDVLYGWSYFQENPTGYFSTEEWFENCHGLILIGEKKPKPSRRQVLQDTLEWAVKLARVPEFKTWVIRGAYPTRVRSGLAAYNAFAEALEHDEDFPADNLDVLTFRCIPIANDGIFLMECKRGVAARFLKNMAEERFPGAEELQEAADAYTQEAQTWHQAAGKTPWSGAPEEERRKIADPALRRELSRLVREAKMFEERAVEHVEKALKELAGH